MAKIDQPKSFKTVTLRIPNRILGAANVLSGHLTYEGGLPGKVSAALRIMLSEGAEALLKKHGLRPLSEFDPETGVLFSSDEPEEVRPTIPADAGSKHE